MNVNVCRGAERANLDTPSPLRRHDKIHRKCCLFTVNKCMYVRARGVEPSTQTVPSMARPDLSKRVVTVVAVASVIFHGTCVVAFRLPLLRLEHFLDVIIKVAVPFPRLVVFHDAIRRVVTAIAQHRRSASTPASTATAACTCTSPRARPCTSACACACACACAVATTHPVVIERVVRVH